MTNAYVHANTPTILSEETLAQFSRRYKFSDWPNRDVPSATAGVYAVWHGDSLVYCGMSGRQIEKINVTRSKVGLVTRLASHASGRLSGDQFCVYVANRLVIPSLKPEQLTLFRTGELSLDRLTRAYISEKLEYQFACVKLSSEAFTLERQCREGATFGIKPLLNPA